MSGTEVVVVIVVVLGIVVVEAVGVAVFVDGIDDVLNCSLLPPPKPDVAPLRLEVKLEVVLESEEDAAVVALLKVLVVWLARAALVVAAAVAPVYVG